MLRIYRVGRRVDRYEKCRKWPIMGERCRNLTKSTAALDEDKITTNREIFCSVSTEILKSGSFLVFPRYLGQILKQRYRKHSSSRDFFFREISRVETRDREDFQRTVALFERSDTRYRCMYTVNPGWNAIRQPEMPHAPRQPARWSFHRPRAEYRDTLPPINHRYRRYRSKILWRTSNNGRTAAGPNPFAIHFARALLLEICPIKKNF